MSTNNAYSDDENENKYVGPEHSEMNIEEEKDV